MERDLGISLRDIEAAEAETARKLAADRAAGRWSHRVKFTSQHGRWAEYAVEGDGGGALRSSIALRRA